MASPKKPRGDQIAGLLAQMIDAIPDKLDDARLGDVIRALVLLRKELEDDENDLEVDTDGARARLEHLIARIADAESAPGDP
ncbi:MAG: hypothetical protein CUN53_15055 [Phototrophicales bacterium]|nr:MAG: hypothetical protein CUN53_15055 [Phototrophicales bacterium]